MDNRFKFLEDTMTNKVYSINTGSLLYLVSNLAKENMILRNDGTRLKLVLLQIIYDLEHDGDNEEYIDWVKNECNLELYSNISLEEVENDARKIKYNCVRKVLEYHLSKCVDDDVREVIMSIGEMLDVSL